jgi:hypothetical protein
MTHCTSYGTYWCLRPTGPGSLSSCQNCHSRRGARDMCSAAAWRRERVCSHTSWFLLPGLFVLRLPSSDLLRSCDETLGLPGWTLNAPYFSHLRCRSCPESRIRHPRCYRRLVLDFGSRTTRLYRHTRPTSGHKRVLLGWVREETKHRRQRDEFRCFHPRLALAETWPAALTSGSNNPFLFHSCQ